MDLCATAILPLRHAAEEAWMSITARYRIAARWRCRLKSNSYG
jgi:hypothetical protein